MAINVMKKFHKPKETIKKKNERFISGNRILLLIKHKSV